MGPTPPGTGVIREATSATPAKWTSPQSRAVVAFVDSDVDDDGAGLDPVGLDLLGPAHRDDEDVGLPGERGGVAGRGVADRHGRIAARPFLDEEQGHRLAHELRSAQDDRVGAAGLDPRVEQQLADAQRRAGDEPRTALRQQAEVLRVEAVHVLQRRDPLDDRPLVDLPRQGHLDEDAVHRRVGVEPVDRRQQLGLARPSAGRRSTVPFIPAAELAFCLLPT